MRLIDADALLEQYNLKDATKYGNKDAEQQANSYSTMMLYEIADMIDDAPTAYDMDKVVEQLEKEAYTTTDTVCGGIFKAIRLSSAIEIVKGGGVDGNNRKDCLR